MIVSCLLLTCIPMASYAGKRIHVSQTTTSDPSGPKRDSIPDIITVDVDQNTCELLVTCNSNVSNIHITLSKAGVTYEDDEASAISGQTFVYSLSTYNDGDYDLVIEVEWNNVAEYTVTIEE